MPVHIYMTDLLHHSLAVTLIVSLAFTRNQPVNGTPPTHCETAKAATVVAVAATPVVHRGSGRPCLWRLHPTLKFAGVIHIAVLQIKLALNSLRFTYTRSVAFF